MWSSWVKTKDTTKVMHIAKLKDGPKRVMKLSQKILAVTLHFPLSLFRRHRFPVVGQCAPACSTFPGMDWVVKKGLLLLKLCLPHLFSLYSDGTR
jgi:hypothetical protein